MGHPGEIDEIFDAISYSKGASVIRMLHEFVGEKVCSVYSFSHKDLFGNDDFTIMFRIIILILYFNNVVSSY